MLAVVVAATLGTAIAETLGVAIAGDAHVAGPVDRLRGQATLAELRTGNAQLG